MLSNFRAKVVSQNDSSDVIPHYVYADLDGEAVMTVIYATDPLAAIKAAQYAGESAKWGAVR